MQQQPATANNTNNNGCVLVVSPSKDRAVLRAPGKPPFLFPTNDKSFRPLVQFERRAVRLGFCTVDLYKTFTVIQQTHRLAETVNKVCGTMLHVEPWLDPHRRWLKWHVVYGERLKAKEVAEVCEHNMPVWQRCCSPPPTAGIHLDLVREAESNAAHTGIPIKTEELSPDDTWLTRTKPQARPPHGLHSSPHFLPPPFVAPPFAPPPFAAPPFVPPPFAAPFTPLPPPHHVVALLHTELKNERERNEKTETELRVALECAKTEAKHEIQDWTRAGDIALEQERARSASLQQALLRETDPKQWDSYVTSDGNFIRIPLPLPLPPQSPQQGHQGRPPTTFYAPRLVA